MLGKKWEAYGVDIEVTCVEYDGPVDVVLVEVLECDVVHVSIASSWSSPGLQSSTVLYKHISIVARKLELKCFSYLSIEHGNVFNVCVVDIVLDTSILSNTAHTDTMSTITVQVSHQDVRGVWLWAKAIIANVNP